MKEEKKMKPRGWITRNKNGTLAFFNKEPEKGDSSWYCFGGFAMWIPPENDVFGDDVKWEDEEGLPVDFEFNVSYDRPKRKKKKKSEEEEK